ncbi:MAG: type II secretion system F family protein [Rhodoferax sp.]|nr:type II secretion system F family protein [Rhodoferax sp.]MDP3653120.1 type II secretion system F family protein [Rhodoferax sp.]
MDLSLVLFVVAAFLAVVLSLEGMYNIWASHSSPEAKRIAARLAALSGTTLAPASIERARQETRMPRLNALLSGVQLGQRMQRFVKASSMAISLAELLMMSMALGAFGLLLPALFGKPPIFGAALGLALSLLPWWRVAVRRRARVERIERQLPEALDLMGRAMRAGHAFPSAVKMVADELPDPLGRDFRILFDEMNYGVSTNDALAHLAERVPVPDVSYFVVAVLIQRESGGNLAELLDKISAIVRDRLKLLGEVRTLSAEGKLSAIILTALPFGVALVVNLVNPTFMDVLWTDPTGLRMVGAACFMMLLGILWMRSIIRIRV